MASRSNTEPLPQSSIKQQSFVANGAVVMFDANTDRNKQVTGTITVEGKKKDMINWGTTNSLPDQRELLIESNNIVPQLLATKRNLVLGQGLQAYQEEYKDGELIKKRVEMPAEIADILEENEIYDEYLPLAAKNLLIHGNVFSQFSGNAGGKRFLKCIESRYIRAQRQNSKGKIPSYFLYGNWGLLDESINNNKTEEPPQEVKAYTAELQKAGKNCILHCADKLLGGPYYYTPHWEGAIEWIKVANCIPQFHFHNLRNGYAIRYVVKVPVDYFVKSLPKVIRDKGLPGRSENEYKEFAKHEEQLRKEWENTVNKFFAGVENAGRALITTKFKKQLKSGGFEDDGIEVIPLDSNLMDEAMLNLFESSNSANTSSHGTPPALAGIATGAKMTSGSEIRNLYNFYQITATTTPRKILLKPVNILLREQLRKEKLKLGFIDIKLETTDRHRDGTSENIN